MILRWEREYFEATRPKMGYFAVLLLVSCHRYQGDWPLRAELWLVALTLVVMIASINWTNDYVDREHDRGKGRALAWRDPSAMLRWSMVGWGWTLALVGLCGYLVPQTLWCLVPMVFCGLGYSWLRAVPLVSGLAVAGCYACAAPLGATLAQNPGSFLAPMAAIFLYVYGRETIADLEDLEIDRGYKATLPVVIGADLARDVMSGVYSLGLVAAVMTQPWLLANLPFFVLLQRAIFADELDFEELYALVDAQTWGFVGVMLLLGG